MREQLQQALVAVKNGQEEQARSILAQLLKEQPNNVAGWILLSKLAQTDVQKAAFLRKVLELDPENEYAAFEMALLAGEAEEGPSEPVLVGTEEEEEGIEEAEVPVPAHAALEAEGAPEESVAEGAELKPTPEAELPPPAEEPGEEATVAAPATELPSRQPEEEPEEEGGAAPKALPVSEEPLDYAAQAEGDTLPPWLADDEAVLESMMAGDVGREQETPPPADIPDWLQELPEQGWAGEEDTATPAVPERALVAPAGRKEAREKTRSRVRAASMSAPVTEGTSSAVMLGLGILLVIIFLLLVYVVLSLI